MADAAKTTDTDACDAETATVVPTAKHHRERAKPTTIPPPSARTPAQLHSQEASRAFYQSTVVPYAAPHARESIHHPQYLHPHRTHWPATHAPSFAWLPPSTPAAAPHSVPYPGAVQLAVPPPQPHYAPVPNPMWTPLHSHHQSPYQYPQAQYAHYFPPPPTVAVALQEEPVVASNINNFATAPDSRNTSTSKLPQVGSDGSKSKDRIGDTKSDPATSNLKNDSSNANRTSGTSGSDTAKQTESDVAAATKDSNIQPPIRKTRKPYTITKHREVWTEKEHSLFLQALQLFNRDWKRIESYIGSKTVLQIRSHAQKHFSKVTKYKTGEYIPPPRPKRRATRPYPRSRGVTANNGIKKSDKGASSKTATASDSGIGSSDNGGNTSGNGKNSTGISNSNTNSNSGGTSNSNSEFGTDDGCPSVPSRRRSSITERPSSQASPASPPKKEGRRQAECLPPVPPALPAIATSASPATSPPVASEKKVKHEEPPPVPSIPPIHPQQQPHDFVAGYNPYYYSAGTPGGLPYAPGHYMAPHPHHPYSHISMPPHAQPPTYIACCDNSCAKYPSHNTFQGLTPGSHLHLAHPMHHQHAVHPQHPHAHAPHLYHHPVAQPHTLPVAKDAASPPRRSIPIPEPASSSIPVNSVEDKKKQTSLTGTASPYEKQDRLPAYPKIAATANAAVETAHPQPHPAWSEGAAARRAARLQLIRAKKQKGDKARPGEEEVIDVDAIGSVDQRKRGDSAAEENHRSPAKPAPLASLLNSEPAEPRAGMKPAPQPNVVLLVGSGGAAPANIPMNDEAVAGFSGSDGSDGSPQEGQERSGTPEEDPNSSSGDDGRHRNSRGSSPTEPNSGGSREDTPSAPDTNASQNNSNTPQDGNDGNGNKRKTDSAALPAQHEKTEEDLQDAAKALSKYQTMAININSLLNNNGNGNNNNEGIGNEQKRGRSPVQERRKNENGTGINLNMNRNSSMSSGRFENDNNNYNDTRQWQRRKHGGQEER